ncbi:MAG TPA: hypothetical protein VKZ18_09570, partial [Polyangia bacterium]|nr:hypothetical protein [Polyangia bacterium]
TNHSDPDFPEIEFGVAPFGTTSSNLTSPNFSSTTLLPIQISALNSATLSLTNYNTTFTKPTYWDANFEFWISKEDPTKNANAQVYAEIIIFLGWNSDRQTGSTTSWPCMSYNPSTISGTNLQLCHQSDTWANNQWRFFNFVATNGPLSSVSGTFDIKQILSWVMSNFANSTNSALGNFSDSMYLTRIEVGTEIDDQTSGSASVGNISFSINGTTKSPTFGP